MSLGIEKTSDDLLRTIEKYMKQGYRRVKCKIKPGYDINYMTAVRKEFGDIMLMCDANSAYTLDDLDLFRKMDELGLLMIEQPLASDDIVDQYMGHVYKNWRGRRNVPAYFADKIDAMLDSDPSNDNSNYGGAKFFLAKASFVPMRGLIIDAEYGFNAKDMGGRKMDNMFMLKATAYIK